MISFIKNEVIAYRFLVKVSGKSLVNTRPFDDAADAEEFMKTQEVNMRFINPTLSKDYATLGFIFECARKQSCTWVDTRPNHMEDKRTPSEWLRVEIHFDEFSSAVQFRKDIAGLVPQLLDN